jgi:hypothetical protein
MPHRTGVDRNCASEKLRAAENQQAHRYNPEKSRQNCSTQAESKEMRAEPYMSVSTTTINQTYLGPAEGGPSGFSR